MDNEEKKKRYDAAIERLRQRLHNEIGEIVSHQQRLPKDHYHQEWLKIQLDKAIDKLVAFELKHK